jgi:hypothetical protein
LFGQQSCVLYGDQCLIGESRDKFDLPVRERLHLLPNKDDHPDHEPLTQERHTECRLPAFDHLGQSEFRVRREVGNVNDPALERGSSCDRAAV